jgi:hypothetical protein
MYVKPKSSAGFGGSTAVYKPNTRGFGGSSTPPSGVLDQYKQYQQSTPAPQPLPTTTPTGIANQIDYTKGLSTAYTPEQELAMRNRIRSTDTAQNAGGQQRISEIMAARGLSGSGAEIGAMGDLMRSQNATRQGALSNLDINNANLDLQNQYAKAGMLNSLTGMGEQARQFDTSQGNNMFQWGKEFDWNKAKDVSTQNEYQKQLAKLYEELGINQPSHPTFNFQRAGG